MIMIRQAIQTGSVMKHILEGRPDRRHPLALSSFRHRFHWSRTGRSIVVKRAGNLGPEQAEAEVPSVGVEVIGFASAMSGDIRERMA